MRQRSLSVNLPHQFQTIHHRIQILAGDEIVEDQVWMVLGSGGAQGQSTTTGRSQEVYVSGERVLPDADLVLSLFFALAAIAVLTFGTYRARTRASPVPEADTVQA